MRAAGLEPPSQRIYPEHRGIQTTLTLKARGVPLDRFI